MSTKQPQVETAPKKVYVGNLKPFGNYGSMKGWITIDPKVIGHWIKTNQKGNICLPVTVNPNKGGADQYGNTHNVTIDTWKPEDKKDGLPF